MDIIAAISTAPAVAAIGVLRLSGAGAFAVADTVFRPLDGRPLSARIGTAMENTGSRKGITMTKPSVTVIRPLYLYRFQKKRSMMRQER